MEPNGGTRVTTQQGDHQLVKNLWAISPPMSSNVCREVFAEARKSEHPAIVALVSHWDAYDGALDSGWEPKWWTLLEAAEEAVGV